MTAALIVLVLCVAPAGRRVLTAAERDTLADWAKAGAPPGDVSKVPPPAGRPVTDRRA